MNSTTSPYQLSSLVTAATAISPISAQQHNLAIEVLNPFIRLNEFMPTHAGQVKHYEGKSIQPAELILLRFMRGNDKNMGLGGEHISATIDPIKRQVIGLTQMRTELTGETFVSHQEALELAITFLKKAAPDLMPDNAHSITLKGQAPGSKMDFSPALKIGHVELQWINDHQEEIIAANQKVTIHGMKVKMYLPTTGLWAWVIIDKYGDIETFERNISWNFKESKRETQKWLHDQWLKEQNIVLPKTPFISTELSGFHSL